MLLILFLAPLIAMLLVLLIFVGFALIAIYSRQRVQRQTALVVLDKLDSLTDKLMIRLRWSPPGSARGDPSDFPKDVYDNKTKTHLNSSPNKSE